MKTNQSVSTSVDKVREITLPKMKKALSRLQSQLSKMEMDANGNDANGSIKVIGHETGRKVVLSFKGSGFNMIINLTQPIAGKGSRL